MVPNPMKTSLTSLLLFACAAGALQAATVQFRVDMNVKAAEGKFSPGADLVDVRGSFDGWGAGFQLDDADGDLVYEGTFDLAPGALGYKFVYVTGGAIDNWETRGDRSATVPAEGVTLPVVYFDDDSEVSVAVPVTFRVDMSVKAGEGVFDPLVDTVDVRGTFNNWSAGTPLEDADGDLVYEGTAEMMGGNIEYKFVYVQAGVDQWESRGNRSATVTGATALPKVYFDDDAVISIEIQTELKFEVDLNVQAAAGKFDPSLDQVWVRGNKVGWDAPPSGYQLTEDPARPGIYVGVLENDLFDPAFKMLTGERFEYKYTIYKTETFETIWEDGGNKAVVFDGSEPDTNANGKLEKSVGLTFFNGISFNDALKLETVVVFQVDMNAAARTDGTPFDPLNEQVYLNGSFVPWWDWGAPPWDYQLHDDGLAGDAIAGDGIYTLEWTFPKGTARKLVYKYGIQGLDNEAAREDNHERFINIDGRFVLPLDTFGAMVKEAAPTLGPISIALAPGVADRRVTLTWTGGPDIRVQRSAGPAAPVWTDVPDTTGVSTITLPAGSGVECYRLARP